MENYADYDALGLAALVARKEVSPSELLDAAVQRAEAAQATLNCFSAMFPDAAKMQISAGLENGPFAGLPFATKDLGAAVENQPLTNGSVAWKGNVASQDSVLTQRFKAAGFAIFGQTTSPEWGLTTSTESTLFGQTRNPWNTSRTSGGSSGGASAAVAAGVIPVAHASDGGGSIRIPAACTGLFGMKPSRGRTPMGPATTEGWNGQSCHGVVSRSVRDSAAALDAIHGPEVGSRYVAPPPSGTFLSALDADPQPLKIALWMQAPNGTRPSEEAMNGLNATGRLLEDLGHTVVEAGPKLDGEALGKSLMMTVSAAMAMVMDAREAEIGRALNSDEMESVTARFREFGNSIPMVELMRANQASIQAGIDFDRFMVDNSVDLVLTPTLSREPDPLGVLSLNPENVDAYGEAVTTFAPWCALFNQIGAPAMSVPLHWSSNDLPIGMMFGARCGQERDLFALAGQLERAKPWADRRPPIWVG
ncbi:MAG: amidase [Pseudomonadota bacterium]